MSSTEGKEERYWRNRLREYVRVRVYHPSFRRAAALVVEALENPSDADRELYEQVRLRREEKRKRYGYLEGVYLRAWLRMKCACVQAFQAYRRDADKGSVANGLSKIIRCLGKAKFKALMKQAVRPAHHRIVPIFFARHPPFFFAVAERTLVVQRMRAVPETERPGSTETISVPSSRPSTGQRASTKRRRATPPQAPRQRQSGQDDEIRPPNTHAAKRRAVPRAAPPPPKRHFDAQEPLPNPIVSEYLDSLYANENWPMYVASLSDDEKGRLVTAAIERDRQ